MKVNGVKIITSVAVGALDEGAIYLDEKKGWTKYFRNATDIYRTVAALGGYALQVWMPRYAAFGDTLATAATPLLTKSIIQTIRKATAPTTTASGTFKRRAAAPMNVAQTTKPEFEGGESY